MSAVMNKRSIIPIIVVFALVAALLAASLPAAPVFAGTPTFDPPVGYTAPLVSSFSFLPVQDDFNNDGKVDQLMVNGNRVQVLLGNGDGTFGTLKSTQFLNRVIVQPGPVQVHLNGYNIQTGDIDNDGNLDIVSGSNIDWGAWFLSVVLGNGDGTFQEPVFYNMPCCGGVRTVALTDLNNDGWLDLVGGESNTSVRVFLNNGDGTFDINGDSTIAQLGNNPQDSEVGDFNQDGKQDVVLANRDAGGSLQVLLGDGTGTLTPQPLLALTTGETGRNLAVGDLNGDGCDDIANINHTGRAVDVYMNNCDLSGTFAALATYVFDPVGPTAFWGYRISDDIVDLDGDGAVDLIVANSAGRGRNGNAIFVLPGNGDGTFGTALGHPNPVEPAAPLCCLETVFNPSYVFARDLNQDGKPDLTTAVNNANRTLAVMLNNTVSSNQAPVADAGPDTTIEWTGQDITLDGSNSSDPDSDPLTFSWAQTAGPSATIASPTSSTTTFTPSDVGTYTFSLTVDDGNGSSDTDSVTVTIEDTTAPVISGVSADPSVLWPPNHKMRSVSVSVDVSDACDNNPTCKIISVASDEPVTGKGHGNTQPDWKITGDLTVDLRAERSGKGDGRVYTITIECTDSSGNSSSSTMEVTVPRNQG